MQKILIVSKKSLGDIILQMGVIQALKAANPPAQIYVACDERNASAVRKHPDVADVIPLKLSGGIARGFFTILKLIRDHRFAVMLTFGRDSQAALWGFLARITKRIGTQNQPLRFLLTHTVREHATQHDSFDFYRRLARVIEPAIQVEYPTLEIDKKESEKLRAYLFKQKIGRRFIVWHIGASAEEKRYPVFQILETLRLFKKKRILLPVLFAGGPGDDAFIAELETSVNASELESPKVYFAQGIEFSGTSALFSLAHLIIANDAAPRHVAAAIGKKSLTLMPAHRRYSWQVYGEGQKAYFLYSEVSSESRAVDTIEPVEVAGLIRKLT